MQEKFGQDGLVFKGTRNAAQFLRQAEIDVLGIDQSGAIHAMDVAFHEAGLNYVGGSDKRVLKKMLRAKLVLDAYHPAETKRHIYFVSPKVHKGVQEPLEEVFKELEARLPEVNWHLITNETFINKIMEPTLEKTENVSDTAELFVRSAKLLRLADSGSAARKLRAANGSEKSDALGPNDRENTLSPTLQEIVQRLMLTLLEEHPPLLSDSDLRNLTDADFCRDELGLRLGGFSLLRPSDEGRSISGHDRYYEKLYAGRYLVSNNWWKRHHSHNAASLLGFVEGLIAANPSSQGVGDLEVHRESLLNYLDQSGC